MIEGRDVVEGVGVGVAMVNGEVEIICKRYSVHLNPLYKFKKKCNPTPVIYL